jgi:hypothetical protein
MPPQFLYFTDTFKSTWSRQRKAGKFQSKNYRELSFENSVQCIDGKAEAVEGDANNTFRCKDVSFSTNRSRQLVLIDTRLIFTTFSPTNNLAATEAKGQVPGDGPQKMAASFLP